MTSGLRYRTRGNERENIVRGRSFGLWTLSAAVFVVVTGEMSPVGLLPAMSADLRVSPGTVGLLMTGYAGVVAISAAPLTALSARLPRKALLLGLMATFVVTNMVVAIAPVYPLLLVVRLLGGAAHGVFFAIVVGLAVRISTGQRSGRSTAIVFFGISVALVLGVPLVTALASLVGWRGSYAVLAGVCALVTLLAVITVAPVDTPKPGGLRALPAVSRIAGIPAVLAATVLICLGHFTTYTYISEFLTHRTGLALGTVTVLLAVYGVSGLVGTWLAGLTVDRWPRASLLAAAGVIALTFILLAALGQSPVAVVLAVSIWGAGFTALPVCLQHTVVRVAPQATDPASAFYGSAFNIGIGGGALLGGLLLEPHGPAVLPAVSLLLVLAAMGVIGSPVWRGDRPATG